MDCNFSGEGMSAFSDKEFEIEFKKQFGYGRITASSNADAYQIMKAAEWAWNASRDKIEFDAGEGADETHCPLSVEEFWIEQIKSKGLKVKT